MTDFSVTELTGVATRFADGDGCGDSLDTKPLERDQLFADRIEARSAVQRAGLQAGGMAEVSSSVRSLWTKVAVRAAEILRTVGKDIEVACMLVEALAWQRGFDGLRDGLAVLVELLDSMGPSLHPRPEKSDTDFRYEYIGNLDRELIGSVRLAPIAGLDAPTLTLDALRRAKNPAPEKVGESEAAFHERLRARLDALSPAGAQMVVETYARVLASLDRLVVACNAKTLGGTVSFGSLAPNVRAAMALVAPTVVLDESDSSPAGSGSDAGGSNSRILATRQWRRDLLLAELIGIAEEFEQHEPQSLLGLELRSVVRRARLGPVELLGELLPDQARKVEALLRAGISLPPASSAQKS